MEQENIIFNTEDVNSNKVYGILAYLGILFIVPLIAAKDSQYARFHANQGLVLFLTEIILGFIGSILSLILGIGTLGLLYHFFKIIISAVIGLVDLAFLIIGIVNACSGEPKKLPIIGGITLIK